MTKAERVLLVCKELSDGNMSKFAKRLSVTPAYISKLKNNTDSDPSDIFIREVCRQYDVSETWLLSGEGDMHASLTEEQEIAQITARMFQEDDADRIRLFRFIASLDIEEIKTLKRIWEKSSNFFDS